jgi:hypothetical protein
VTATEGLAFAGIVVALVSTYLTYRTGKEARDDAHKLATENRTATAEEARAARLFDARKAVYVDVMDYVYRIEDFVSRTESVLTWEGMPGPPEFPPEDEQRRQSAQTAAFGSKAILDKLMEFKRAGQDFQGAVWLLQGQRKHFGLHSNEAIEAWQAVEAKRQVVKGMVLELMALVNADLAR